MNDMEQAEGEMNGKRSTRKLEQLLRQLLQVRLTLNDLHIVLGIVQSVVLSIHLDNVIYIVMDMLLSWDKANNKGNT